MILQNFKQQKGFCRRQYYFRLRCPSFLRALDELGKEYSCLVHLEQVKLYLQKQLPLVEEPPSLMYQQVAQHQNGKVNLKSQSEFYSRWLNSTLLLLFFLMKQTQSVVEENKEKTNQIESNKLFIQSKDRAFSSNGWSYIKFKRVK